MTQPPMVNAFWIQGKIRVHVKLKFMLTTFVNNDEEVMLFLTTQINKKGGDSGKTSEGDKEFQGPLHLSPKTKMSLPIICIRDE